MLAGADWKEERSHMGLSDHPLHTVTHFPSKEATASHCPNSDHLEDGRPWGLWNRLWWKEQDLPKMPWLSPEGLAAYTYLSRIKFYFC